MKSCSDCNFNTNCDIKDNGQGISLFGGDCIWFEPKIKEV